jgi:hypothetical protein
MQSAAAAAERRAERLLTLAVAIHEAAHAGLEAAHAVAAAAIQMPLARAVARGQGRGRSGQRQDGDARRPASPPLPIVGADAAGRRGLGGNSINGTELRRGVGGQTSHGRPAARPMAALRAALRRYVAARSARLVCRSRAFTRAGHPRERGWAPYDWTEATLDRHRETLWRLAVLLYRRGRLTAPELDRALAPVAADSQPRARLLDLAHLLVTSPEFLWPGR